MALVATNREDEPVLSGSPTHGGVTRKGQRHVRERGGGGVSSQAAYVHSGKFIIRASNLARGSYFLSLWSCVRREIGLDGYRDEAWRAWVESECVTVGAFVSIIAIVAATWCCARSL